MIHDIARLGDRIREISYELRPGMLDQLGLVPALETYVKDINKQHEGIQVHFPHIGFMLKGSPPEVEIALYRVTQEALNNIMRHTKAKHASIILTFNPPEVILTITDDGVGFLSHSLFIIFRKRRSRDRPPRECGSEWIPLAEALISVPP